MTTPQDLMTLIEKLDEVTGKDHALVLWSDTSGRIHRKGGEFDVPLASFHSFESAKRSLDKLIVDSTPKVWEKRVSFGLVKVVSEYWGISWTIAPAQTSDARILFADKLVVILNEKFNMSYRLKEGTVLVDEDERGEMIVVSDDGSEPDENPYQVRFGTGHQYDWVSIDDDVKVANYDEKLRLAVLTEAQRSGLDISRLGLLQ